MMNSEARKRQVPAPDPSPLTDERCAWCGRVAEGMATIDDARYCHGDDAETTCYMRAQWHRSEVARALAEQREQIATAIEGRRVHIHAVNESACEDGCGWLDFAARIVREWGAR